MITCNTYNLDDTDSVVIKMQRGDEPIIPIAVKDGQYVSDANFKMIVKPSNNSGIEKVFTIADGNVTKSTNCYEVDFADLPERLRRYGRLVYDVFGHEDHPKRRIAKGIIIINSSTL